MKIYDIALFGASLVLAVLAFIVLLRLWPVAAVVTLAYLFYKYLKHEPIGVITIGRRNR